MSRAISPAARMIRQRKGDNLEGRCLHLAFRVLTVVTIGMAGCAAPPPEYTVKSSDPTAAIPAIRIAVEKKDQSVVPALVKDLDSDDPAVRFYANDGLKKLTGQNFGYLYYADDHTRESAVKRWQAWLAKSAQSAPDEAGAAAQTGGEPTAQLTGQSTGGTGGGTNGATSGPAIQDVR